MTTIFSRPPSLRIICALAALLWVGEYALRDLWEPDEARYAYVAREMNQTGSWFAMTLHGEPYPDKPPLLFWLINVTRFLTGGEITSLSARLPSLLGAIMSLWAVTRLMTRWSGPAAAWRAMMILMTSFLFWQEGGWARTDSLLCGCEMVAVYFLYRGSETRQVRHWVAAFLFLGLAILAKGPIGLVVPLGIFIASTLAAGEGRSLRSFHWFWGIPLALLPGLFWLFMAWRANAPDEYFHAMFTSKTVGRILESPGHANPFYHYLWHFPLDFLPWTFLLPAAWLALSHNQLLRRRLTAWIAWVILLFSIPVCKREIYILAAFPGAAMLIASGWDHFQHLRPRIPFTSFLLFIGFVGLLMTAEAVTLATTLLPGGLIGQLLPEFARIRDAGVDLRYIWIPCLALFVGFSSSSHILRTVGVGAKLFIAMSATLFVHQIAVSTAVLPQINAMKAPHSFAESVNSVLPAGSPLYIYQEQLAILPLYANRPGRSVADIHELLALIARQPTAIVVFMKPTWDEVSKHIKTPVEVHPFGYGRKRIVWVNFQPNAHPLGGSDQQAPVP